MRLRRRSGGVRRGAAGGGAQPCHPAGVRFGHVPDLAGAQQPVGVEVAAVMPRERLGQHRFLKRLQWDTKEG
jgi:hypothetical protein